jgi:hypothetical protein
MISKYLSADLETINNDEGLIPDSLSKSGTGEAKFKVMLVLDQNMVAKTSFYFKEKIAVKLLMQVSKNLSEVVLAVYVVNNFGERFIMAIDNEFYRPCDFEAGMHEVLVKFDEELMPGDYSIALSIAHYHTGSVIDFIESFGNFKVMKETSSKEMEYPWGTVHGYTVPRTHWSKKLIK